MEQNINEAMEYICKSLSSRQVTLFFGSGINEGIKNNSGLKFPLGSDLAKLICKDVIGDELLDLTLDEAAEYAKSKVGSWALNKYIYELFIQFKPSSSHISAVQLPWDTIYTTNYDLLLENAQNTHGIMPAGVIQPIVSCTTDLSQFNEDDILYYKLHGSIDYANTEEGRLILTKGDYRYYKKSREGMFKRLADDLMTRTFVFIGYSMRDPNFREILEDCRNALNIETFPLSYAVRPGFRPAEAEFWREKYNIQLIDTEGQTFLEMLKNTWFTEGHTVLPLDKRKASVYFQADSTTLLPKLTDCYYQLDIDKCIGRSQPKEFFCGAEPTWADIKDGIAPSRDLYWTILDALFEELVNPNSEPAAYLVTGYAGTGKTTLLRTLAFSLAKEFNIPVLIHIAGTPLDVRDIRPFASQVTGKRIILLVHDAAEKIIELRQLYHDSKKFNLPLTLLLEDRTNQWIAATESLRDFDPEHFTLGALSQNEAENIVDALRKYNALGKLTSNTREECIEHFTALADKELLVALREMTTGSRFDKIIKNEYEKIPGLLAKKAYAFVSALSQIDLYIREATLLRLLKCEVQELWTTVFKPTEGILISNQVTGRSRHTTGYRIRTRHPVIASIVFASAAPGDEEKLSVINAILSMMDIGYKEDRELLNQIIQRKELVKTLSSVESQRNVYDNLERIVPNNPYVFQHRSILERELGHHEEALRCAHEAVRINSNNPVFRNTLGFALEAAARNEKQIIKRRSMLSEALRIFEEAISNEPNRPYGYLGQIYVLRQHSEDEKNTDRKNLLKADILSILEVAREETDNASVIEQEYAKELSLIGHKNQALSILEKALEGQPGNERISNLLINLLLENTHTQADIEKAKKVAKEGIKRSPNSWRLCRQMGRINALLNSQVDIVVEHYEAAIRNNRMNPVLYIELASYLFENQEHNKATMVFQRADHLPLPSQSKHKIYKWYEINGCRKLFNGVVHHILGAGAHAMAIPENFTAFFWRNKTITASLMKGDKISFYVGFNCRGAIAEIVGSKR